MQVLRVSEYGYGSMEEFDKANYIVRNVDDLREMFIC